MTAQYAWTTIEIEALIDGEWEDVTVDVEFTYDFYYKECGAKEIEVEVFNTSFPLSAKDFERAEEKAYNIAWELMYCN